jgi:hypothetical protein
MVPKELRKFSKQFRERVKMEREWTHAKRFEVEMCFSSLKIFILVLWETFENLFFLSFFQYVFSLFFRFVSLGGGGGLKINEEKTSSKLFLDGMEVTTPWIWK